MSNKHVDDGVECVDGEDDFNFQLGLKDLQRAIDQINNIINCNLPMTKEVRTIFLKDAIHYIDSGIGLVKIYR